MPLYEYHCQDCDQPSELLVRSPDEKPDCPSCGSRKMTRLLSVVAAHSGKTGPSGNRQPPPGPCGSSCGCFPAP